MAIKASNSKEKKENKLYLPSRFILIKSILAVVFYVIWILIGIALLLLIYANFKQGAFSGLFGKQPPAPQAGIPQETTIPGVGRVNIECVQNALSNEAIQKIVTDGNTSNLTEDEKAKFEPCIVEKEEATQPPSP